MTRCSEHSQEVAPESTVECSTSLCADVRPSAVVPPSGDHFRAESCQEDKPATRRRLGFRTAGLDAGQEIGQCQPVPRCLVATSVGLLLAALLSGNAFGIGSFGGDGKYRVAQDVRPGTYRSLGGDGCYWARLKNFSGSLSSIVANENADGPTLVTIKSSDRGFETARCRNWTRNLRRITKSMTRFGEGTYIVRVDIAPGTYRSRGVCRSLAHLAPCAWAPRIDGLMGRASGF